MYDELSAAWRFEIENTELGSLPSDFYDRIADYVRRIKGENRMLDKKTLKAVLLEHEMERIKHMVRELVWARYEKLVKMITADQKIPAELVAAEETKLFGEFLSFAEAYHRFVEKLLQGQVLSVAVEKAHKRVALRFLKAIPAVIGADMKIYGPFIVEDVASLPLENAKILIKQGLAEAVEA